MSRLGSQPAASRKAASRRVAVPKAKSDIYTALLAIALGAVVIACIILAMEMQKYEWKVTPKAAQVGPSWAAPLACGGGRAGAICNDFPETAATRACS